MKLQRKKQELAKKILEYMKEHRYEGRGFNSSDPFMIELKEMADGKDRRFSKEMNWTLYHFDIVADKKLMDLFMELSQTDRLAHYLKWLPWIQ